MAHAWKVHAMNFQLNLSNGSGHAAEKSPCSPCKVLLIINQLKPKLQPL